MWLDPMYDVNSGYWPTLFHEEREAALNRFTDENPPSDAILASARLRHQGRHRERPPHRLHSVEKEL
jgi:hypothetical protein